MTTVVIDYGGGNICSVMNALEELGEEASIATQADAVREAERIILPGVGALAPAMAQLQDAGLDTAIDHAVRHQGTPYLGICLGMQMMAKRGFEGGCETQGFGWIDADVIALDPRPPSRRVPHMGWAVVNWSSGHAISQNIRDEAAFYFCHSFHVGGMPQEVCASVDFDGEVVAGLQCGSAIGVQFHPERSGNSGLKLIENFLDWDGGSESDY